MKKLLFALPFLWVSHVYATTIDISHISRKASYTSFVVLQPITGQLVVGASYDTDRDGVIAALYNFELENFNITPRVEYKYYDAGYTNIKSGITINRQLFEDLNFGISAWNESGIKALSINDKSIGNANKNSVKAELSYDTNVVGLRLSHEEFDNKNQFWRYQENYNETEISGTYYGVSGIRPYITLKFKDYERDYRDDEVRIGIKIDF